MKKGDDHQKYKFVDYDDGERYDPLTILNIIVKVKSPLTSPGRENPQ
jgi:hypothetical protein